MRINPYFAFKESKNLIRSKDLGDVQAGVTDTYAYSKIDTRVKADYQREN